MKKRKKSRKKSKTSKRIKEKVLKRAGICIAALILLLLGFYGAVYFGVFGRLPTTDQLSSLSQKEASLLLDDQSRLLGKYFITDRETVTYDEFPTFLIQALIATEDARFYKHKGIDNYSLFRVLLKSIALGDRSSGGGSTITLQLAKNLYGRRHYRFMGIVVNKLRESIVARRLEKVYSKKEILTLYLNTVPFSGDTYGIESAAQKFYGIKTKALTLSQAATLVGTLKANHSYNPYLFPEKSQLRRDVVLQQMVKHGYLEKEEADEIMQRPLQLHYKNYASSMGPAPYFREYVRKEVQKILAHKHIRKADGTPYHLKEDGLRIYTTLNAELQSYAQKAVRKRMKALQVDFERSFNGRYPWDVNTPVFESRVKELQVYKNLQEKGWSKQQIMDSLNVQKRRELFNWDKNEIKESSTIDSLQHYLKFLNAGFVAMDPHNGELKAYVGGIDYRYFQYDHVRQSKRQVGSTFKPFVYATAFDNGWTPCDYFSGKEVTYLDQKNWTPRNADPNMDLDREYSLAEALTKSMNTVTVKVLREVGIPAVVDQVHKLGISEKIEPTPSIALGTSSLGLLDLTTAYSAFLNDGHPVTPYFIKRIEDKDGKLLFEHETPSTLPIAMSNRTRLEVLEILKNVVNRGTASRLRYTYGLSNALAGKTGTTQDNTDGWFVGMLPDLVTVTWVGHDDPRIKFPTTSVGQGANSALPIFAYFVQDMNKDARFDKLTKAKFEWSGSEIASIMGCAPTQKRGFLDRLFKPEPEEMYFDKTLGKPEQKVENETERKRQKKIEKQQYKKQKKKEKKGFFKRLFGKKKNE